MSLSPLRELRAVYRDDGPRAAVVELLRKLGVFKHFTYSLQEVAALDLTEAALPELCGTLLREAGRSDIALLSRLGIKPQTAEAYFDSGYRLWLLEERGEPLAYDWLATMEKPFWDFLILEGGEGDVWHWAYEVARAHRGRGLGTRIRGAVAARCRQEGHRRALGNYATHNKASKQVLAKLGYRPLTRLFHLRFGPLKLVVFRRRLFIGRWTEERRLRLAVP